MVEKGEQGPGNFGGAQLTVWSQPRVKSVSQLHYPAVKTPAWQKDETVCPVYIGPRPERRELILHSVNLLFDGDALGQIPGLVHITSAQHRNVIGDELERQGKQ